MLFHHFRHYIAVIPGLGILLKPGGIVGGLCHILPQCLIGDLVVILGIVVGRVLFLDLIHQRNDIVHLGDHRILLFLCEIELGKLTQMGKRCFIHKAVPFPGSIRSAVPVKGIIFCIIILQNPAYCKGFWGSRTGFFCAGDAQQEFIDVTIWLRLVSDALRAPHTQKHSTDVLGKFVLLYLFNRMGHA